MYYVVGRFSWSIKAHILQKGDSILHFFELYSFVGYLRYPSVQNGEVYQIVFDIRSKSKESPLEVQIFLKLRGENFKL